MQRARTTLRQRCERFVEHQRSFQFGATLEDRAPEQSLGLAEAVLDRLLVDEEALSGGNLAAAALERDAQRLAQAFGDLVVGGQRAEFDARELAGAGFVGAEDREQRDVAESVMPDVPRSVAMRSASAA